MAVYTESFNKANAATLGPDLSWTEVDGTSWGVTSNQAAIQAAGDDSHARAEHDTDTSDMYVEATVTAISGASGNNGVGGVWARFASAASTGYVFQAEHGSADAYTLRRWNADVESAALASSPQDPAPGDRIRLEVTTPNASTVSLRALVNDIQLLTFDDTSADRVTTGTRAGLRGIELGSGVVAMDDFEFGDLAGGVFIPSPSSINIILMPGRPG